MSLGHRNPSQIKTAAPFDELFPIDATTQNAVCKSMGKTGFDPAHPLVIWAERDVLIDGHTRLDAAIYCEVPTVPVVVKHFLTEDEAVEYAIHCQRDRRNITESDILRWLGELERRKAGKLPSDVKSSPRTLSEISETLGITESKAKKASALLSSDNEEAKSAVLAGEKTINAAYTETQTRRKSVCVEPNMPITNSNESNGRSAAPTKPRREEREKPLREQSPRIYEALTVLANEIKAERKEKWRNVNRETLRHHIESLVELILI